MVFAHQHHVIKASHAVNCNDCHSTAKQNITEKCQLCDSMHHLQMELTTVSYHTPFLTANHVYTTFEYHFKRFALVLSQGRAPPVIS